MEFLNSGSSLYHEICAFYIRDSNWELLDVWGARSATVEEIWSSLRESTQHPSSHRQSLQLDKEAHTDVVQLDPELSSNILLANHLVLGDSSGSAVIRVQEIEKQGSFHGVISVVPAKHEDASLSFRTWATALVLLEPKITVKSRLPAHVDVLAEQYATQITDLFDEKLRNTPLNDQWGHIGRERFQESVLKFTSGSKTVEFCLPAFPCKSSNLQKTAGRDPDLAEQIALETLHEFVKDIQGVYPPGAKVWIVSDGHVFSDCIGVDDSTVDTYSAKLQQMNSTISPSLTSIDFLSLTDTFFSSPALAPIFDPTWLTTHPLSSLVDVNPTLLATNCRSLMMKTCEANSANLRAKINGQDASTLALYRGFSRFMLEDLAMHKTCQGLSQSQRKKLSAKVAFEMIKRNQAYSNLVEMLFPGHIRLSIHAHPNTGPKYGIQLLPHSRVRGLRTLADRLTEPASCDLLHTPTPWHNCLVQIVGETKLFLVKSGIVRDALENGEYEGKWEEAGMGGGRWVIRETQKETVELGKGEVEVVIQEVQEVADVERGLQMSEKGRSEDMSRYLDGKRWNRGWVKGCLALMHGVLARLFKAWS